MPPVLLHTGSLGFLLPLILLEIGILVCNFASSRESLDAVDVCSSRLIYPLRNLQKTDGVGRDIFRSYDSIPVQPPRAPGITKLLVPWPCPPWTLMLPF